MHTDPSGVALVHGRPGPLPPSGRPEPAAAVADLTKVYGEGDAAVVALDRVSLTLEAQRFTAIMGPSGSGKSTLLHCMAGLERPTSGHIRIGGLDITELDDRALTLLRRDRLGFVFQAYNLVPTLTAEENILLPSMLGRRRPDPAWLDAIVATLGLSSRLGHRPSELSGGQQQRVGIARALATRPELVFADEPTGNLDSGAGREVLSFFRRAVDELGRTIVMVTHDPVAAAHADRVLFLADGSIVDELASPTSHQVLDRLKGIGG
jgi:putative ABC transport system ATP-binding protein